MDALDIIVLGRQLTRIGEQAMRDGGADDSETSETGALGATLPTGALIVMRDVLAHPASSITDITARTGLPQSYVSESVNKLRVKGIAEISADPSDRRRTLVRLRAKKVEEVARHSARNADHVLRSALGKMDDAEAAEVIAMLAGLADHLRAEPTSSARS
ncbi:MAG: winged helix-turn-helix transcriptional regulator [Actinobacteria bacterium]|nr:winged helix-turn-helix transcriptional regulator [Actinomycetota bacterium]